MNIWRKSFNSYCYEKENLTYEPPMPDSVCKEEIQNATVENDVIIEYITDAQGRKVKKLKPLLIKTEPDREYIQHIHSDDNLPDVPEDKFIQKREETVDSYSETISSDSSSDDSTITADPEDSTSSMEDKSCVWETDSTEIEAMQFISMDLIGEFHPPTTKGKRYALTVTCMLMGYVFCIPLKTKTC